MEKLKKKDAEAGVQAQVLTDSQRAEIAEAKSVYDARVAERHIMHRSSTAKVFDPAELQERETELRRDLERFASDRDAKNQEDSIRVNRCACSPVQNVVVTTRRPRDPCSNSASAPASSRCWPTCGNQPSKSSGS